jgi:rod shape-determining protein MreD
MILSFVIQSTLFHFIRIYNVSANLVLIALIILSLQTDEVVGGFLGFFTGMLWDVYYSHNMGIYALILLIIGFVSGKLSDNVYKFDFLTNLYFTIFGTLFFHLAYYLINYFLKLEASAILYMSKFVFLEIILNSLILYPIFKFEKYIFRKYKIKFD